MVGGVGRPDITIPGADIGAWIPPVYTFGESVLNISLQNLDLESHVPTLEELRATIHDYYSNLAEESRDEYLQENLVNQQIAEQAAIDLVRICPPIYCP